MVADPGDDLDGAIVEHVHLHDLTLPELVPDDLVDHGCERLLRIFLGNCARHHQQVGGKTRLRQDAAVDIDIVVVALGRHDVHNGHALFQVDADESVLGLVALCLLHERVLLEAFLDVAGIDGHHGLCQRVEVLFLQHLLDILRVEEAIGHLVVDIDLHL